MPERNPIRTAFTIIAAAATVFGLGWMVLSNHPYFGTYLMAAGILYLIYEFFDSSAVRRIAPPMFRFLGAIFTACIAAAIFVPRLPFYKATHPTVATSGTAQQPQQGNPPQPQTPTPSPVPERPKGGEQKKPKDKAEEVGYCYLALAEPKHYFLTPSPSVPPQNQLMFVVKSGKSEPISADKAVIVTGAGGLSEQVPGFIRKIKTETPIPLSGKQNGDKIPFFIGDGSYTFKIHANRGVLTEQFQTLYRNGEWLQIINVIKDGVSLLSTPMPPDQPDISLSVFNANRLLLSLDNTSKGTAKVVKEPSYYVVLWDVSPSNRTKPPLVWRKTLKEDEILPKISLLVPLFSDTVEQPKELYGYAEVSCVDCEAIKAYYIYTDGETGWYRQLELGAVPWSTESFVKSITGDFKTRLFKMPDEIRSPIVPRPLY